MGQDELLDGFLEWRTQKHGGAAGSPLPGKIKEAQRALKEDFEEVGTIRKVKEKDWVRLGVPVGLGKA